MIEITGNIWDYHASGNWIVITTNGIVRTDGACVMGRGIALQAKQKYPRLAFELGERLREAGNHVHVFPKHKIISFPVKHHWKEPADCSLIEQSARELFDVVAVYVDLGISDGMRQGIEKAKELGLIIRKRRLSDNSDVEWTE